MNKTLEEQINEFLNALAQKIRVNNPEAHIRAESRMTMDGAHVRQGLFIDIFSSEGSDHYVVMLDDFSWTRII